jgi:hypothetical protein
MGNAIAMAHRVFRRQQSSPGVAKKRELVYSEVHADFVEVIDLALDADIVGPDASGRSTSSPLVVIDEATMFG